MPGISVRIRNTSLEPDAWESACDDILEFLISATPVDTGLCADSWELDYGDDESVFSNDTEYASYLEDGWSDQAPNGMIKELLSGPLDDIVSGYR